MHSLFVCYLFLVKTDTRSMLEEKVRRKHGQRSMYHGQRNMAEICMWVRGTVMGIVRTFLYAEAGKSGCCEMVGLHEDGMRRV